MYPEPLVKPMKEELTQVGFEECLTPEAVDKVISQPGTVLMVVNSVCGCAAGACRPGVKASLNNAKKPTALTTVFAGFDVDAVSRARKHFAPYPPSSPAIALFKDGQLVHFVERHNIEGHSANAISEHLKAVYDEFC
ncbi:MAG TPA: BrxA/BrxB family bacilliredoxin [Bacteroidia bacterium]|jgi:putative YphP/YqiW family bacilliredoxin|nr:BrxA/BrxB family bacilliredoxin [Bacteroidia bacterium]HXU27717.1 BrxA/BrxB family bacilliredoxin [Bacteroidia bacterium]